MTCFSTIQLYQGVKMRFAKKRKIIVIAHLVGAMFLGIYLYSPLENNQYFRQIVKFGVVPLLLSFTGIMLSNPRLLRKK